MPSVLDTRMDAVTARLTGPDGAMPVSTVEIGGVALPYITAAPPALSHYFAYFCALHGDKEFLVDGDERLSFAQVYVAANQVAKALVSGYGVKRGDRVGIAARNAPSWIILYMGILMAGGVATLLNGWWQGGELADGIDDVGVSLLIADAPRAKRLSEANRSIMACQPRRHSRQLLPRERRTRYFQNLPGMTLQRSSLRVDQLANPKGRIQRTARWYKARLITSSKRWGCSNSRLRMGLRLKKARSRQHFSAFRSFTLRAQYR
jgi:hypothetical protein